MTFRSPRLLAALLAGAIALAPLAAVAQQTVKHAQGETSLTGVPAKVLTFDLATLDNLDALGVPVAGVPTITYPDYLSRYAGTDVEKIGTLFEPNYEIVNAAGPDLIVVAGRSAAKYPDLARIAPTIDLSVNAKDFFASAKANLETLGAVFGKPAEATALIGTLDAAVAEARAAAPDAGKALILMVSGGKVTAYGTGSRFGWLHSELGLVPAVENVDEATHGDAISFEYILEANPDLLIVVDRDVATTGGAKPGQAAREVLNNELVAQTSAWKNGDVVYLEPSRAYIVGGGIQALTDLVNQVVDGIDG